MHYSGEHYRLPDIRKDIYDITLHLNFGAIIPFPLRS